MLKEITPQWCEVNSPKTVREVNQSTRDNDSMARPQKSDPNRPDWAKRLEAARVLTGLDGKAFAGEIGIHEERYRKYERGEREPNIQIWAKISDFTGVSLDVLIKGVKNQPDTLRKIA